MRSPFLLKAMSIGFFGLLLSFVLLRIGYLVDERAERQRDAIRSVQASQAGEQVIIGPFVQRKCTESWIDNQKAQQQTQHVGMFVPTNLQVGGSTAAQTLYRGIFKVNGYTANLTIDAQWQPPPAMEPKNFHDGGKMSCEPFELVLALGDVRGVRDAKAQVNGVAGTILPGTNSEAYKQGFRVAISTPRTQEPLHTHLELELAGTGALSVVPLGESTVWDLQSDWPHPSFGGQFLPGKRAITDTGFTAQWKVSSLASAAAKQFGEGQDSCRGAASFAGKYDVQDGAPVPRGDKCMDTLSVSFIDPVNPYMLSDRAIKYGLLFIALTFAAVGMAELVGAGRVRRVHPIQYALVGMALCLFFLLLLSLSEHIQFWMAYAIASAACVLLLGSYAANMLGRMRDGWLFGMGVGVMYGLVYLLLQLEQTALVIGAVSLFAVLAVVMWLTRRFDWYRLLEQARVNTSPVPANPPAKAAVPNPVGAPKTPDAPKP